MVRKAITIAIELISIRMDANELYRYCNCFACHLSLQQKALDKTIGACTNNRAVSIYASNGKDIANKALFLHYKVYFMLNSKINVINRNILMLLYLMRHAISKVSRLDNI